MCRRHSRPYGILDVAGIPSARAAPDVGDPGVRGCVKIERTAGANGGVDGKRGRGARAKYGYHLRGGGRGAPVGHHVERVGAAHGCCNIWARRVLPGGRPAARPGPHIGDAAAAYRIGAQRQGLPRAWGVVEYRGLRRAQQRHVHVVAHLHRGAVAVRIGEYGRVGGGVGRGAHVYAGARAQQPRRRAGEPLHLVVGRARGGEAPSLVGGRPRAGLPAGGDQALATRPVLDADHGTAAVPAAAGRLRTHVHLYGVRGLVEHDALRGAQARAAVVAHHVEVEHEGAAREGARDGVPDVAAHRGIHVVVGPEDRVERECPAGHGGREGPRAELVRVARVEGDHAVGSHHQLAVRVAVVAEVEGKVDHAAPDVVRVHERVGPRGGWRGRRVGYAAHSVARGGSRLEERRVERGAGDVARKRLVGTRVDIRATWPLRN